MRTRALLCTLVLLLVNATAITSVKAAKTQAGARHLTTPVGDIALEFVGQVINSAPGVTPATSMQFGYVSYIRGLTTIFKADPQNETTALYTWFTDATTSRVISDGPLRIINRTATETVYQDASVNSDFTKPDTFRDGLPIQVSTLRQQVIVDTISGVFTCVNLSTVISVKPFTSDGVTYMLGRVGDRFRSFHDGRLAAQGPPTGYVAGYIVNAGHTGSGHKYRSGRVR